MSVATPVRPQSVKPGTCTRRAVLRAGGALLLAVCAPRVTNATQIIAVRVWPAQDYTRVTLEHDGELKARHFMVKDPARLVIDVDGLDLNPALKELVAKVQANDPYIQQVRVGQNRPGVVRLVFDLKEDVNPQVFNLEPVGTYQHRLVFDLYPVNAHDPIAALIQRQQEESPPAPASSAVIQEPARPQHSKRPITIALDPGHGGEDPGAIGRGGNQEKDVVLAIAKRLKDKLEQHDNTRVTLTRDADFFVPLQGRVQKARAVKADLFVSIHADAFVDTSARGTSVFALSEKGASSAAARMLANHENAADLIGGVNLSQKDRQLASVLLDLSTTAQITDSLKLGKVVLGELGGVNRLHRGMVEQAGFAVLKAPDIPSILIETAFISNPEEEARLIDERYQDKLAETVAKGIRKYFQLNPPLAKA